MLGDFELIQHSFLGGHDITIIPVFDVHLGSQECMEQEFIRFIKKVAETPNVYLIIGGDLIDNGTKSSVTNVFRATMSPSQQKKEMANILKPVADRILCIIPGNHERRSGKDADDDPVYDIAAKIDVENLYRENAAFVKIQLGVTETSTGNKTNGVYRPTYTIVVFHGSGGGALSGGVINKNERMGYAIDGADLILVGHSHKPMVSQPGKIVIDTQNNKVSVKPFRVISATSWLEWGGYATQKMLLPTSHAMQTITLSGRHKDITITM